jgi:hypothetical protein
MATTNGDARLPWLAFVMVAFGAVGIVAGCGRTSRHGAPAASGGTTDGAGGLSGSDAGGADATSEAGAGATPSSAGGSAGAPSSVGGRATGGSAGAPSSAGTVGTAGTSSSAAGIGAAAGMDGISGAGAAAGVGGAPARVVLQPGEVAVGVQSSCALVGDGTAKCWGNNDYGQLGNGEKRGGALKAAPVIGLSGLKMLASGEYHVCALTFEGTVSCWGLINDSSTPLPVSGLSDIAMIAVSASDSCALRRDGTVWCWAKNSDPVAVVGIDDATFIAVGNAHRCAVLADGSVKCWGSNGGGELGDGTTASSQAPVWAKGMTDAVLLALGSGFSCALTTQLRASCWGDRAPSGTADDVVLLTADDESACIAQVGTFPQCSGSELPAMGLTGLVDADLDLAELKGMAFDSGHGCVVVGDAGARSAWCWGSNVWGQLGAGTEASSAPVRVEQFP